MILVWKSGIPRPTLFGIPFNASDEGFAATFGLEFSPVYRTLFLFTSSSRLRWSPPT